MYYQLLPVSMITISESSPLINALLLTIIFSAVGLGILLGGFRVIDACTLGSLSKELVENKNVALAIVVGAMILGLAFIIAAAISG